MSPSQLILVPQVATLQVAPHVSEEDPSSSLEMNEDMHTSENSPTYQLENHVVVSPTSPANISVEKSNNN